MTIEEIKRQAIKAARKVKKEDVEESIEFYKPTAQEMFEELGYCKVYDTETRIVYDNNVDLDDEKYGTRIIFKLDLKELKFSVNEIDLKELQAINQQCKELG